MKKLVSLLLCLALLLCTAFPAAATETTLPALDAPTDLTWGKYYGSDLPGAISFKPGTTTQCDYELCIYQIDGSTETLAFHTNWDFGSTFDTDEYLSCDSFIEEDLGSGTYYFTLTAVGDGTNYKDSETVKSGTWTYTAPSQSLKKPSNLSLTWDDTYGYLTATWDNPSDSTFVGGYEISWWYAETADGEKKSVYSCWSEYASTTCTLPDSSLSEYGTGYYFFEIRLLSNDITQYKNSEWTDYSNAYNLTELTQTVAEELESILDSTDSDAEKVQAVQDMDTGKLKASILADSNVLDMLAQLETESAGGQVAVEVTDDASAFDQSEVSIIGANLNAAADTTKDIKLIVDKPEKEHVIPAQYNNAVAISFSMDWRM